MLIAIKLCVTLSRPKYMYRNTIIHSLAILLGRLHLTSTGLNPLLPSEMTSLHSLWHRFNEVLETFLRDFGPYFLKALRS